MTAPAVTHPTLHVPIRDAIAEALDSMPAAVRKSLSGRFRWRIDAIPDRQTAAIAIGNTITFAPWFLYQLSDTGETSALVALAAHELAHVYRHLRGEKDGDYRRDEAGTNNLIRRWGFAHDLCRLQQISGHRI